MFQVKVVDSGSPEPLTSTTRVVVTIADENDEAPRFTERQYRILIPEMPVGAYDIPLFR